MATDLQKAMLRAISRSDFTNVNGREPKTLEDIGAVWVVDVVNTSQDKGTLTSLQNGGYVHIFDYDKNSKYINMTKLGWEAIHGQ